MISAIGSTILGLPWWLVLGFAFALPALESSAFVGFVFPGEAALVVGGVVAAEGRVPVVAVIAAGALGAIAGDAVGYLVGRRWGPWVLATLPHRLVPPARVERAVAYLRRSGGKAVFVGRFTATLRVLVPGVAGMAGMPYRKFAVANVSSALGWSVLSVLIGYLGGRSWQQLSHTVGHVALVGIAVLAVAVAATHLIRGRRRVTSAGEPELRPPGPGCRCRASAARRARTSRSG